MQNYSMDNDDKLAISLVGRIMHKEVNVTKIDYKTILAGYSQTKSFFDGIPPQGLSPKCLGGLCCCNEIASFA